MIVAKQLIEEVNGLVADKALILSCDERVPRLARESRQNIVVLRIQLDVVLVQVLEEFLRSKHLGDLDELIGVAVSMEERFLAENHGSEHGAKRPHV